MSINVRTVAKPWSWYDHLRFAFFAKLSDGIEWLENRYDERKKWDNSVVFYVDAAIQEAFEQPTRPTALLICRIQKPLLDELWEQKVSAGDAYKKIFTQELFNTYVVPYLESTVDFFERERKRKEFLAS